MFMYLFFSWNMLTYPPPPPTKKKEKRNAEISGLLMAQLCFLSTGFLMLSSNFCACRCWRTVHYLWWRSFNFFVQYSRTYYQNIDLGWNQKLESSSPCSSCVCWRMCFSLVSCRRWLFWDCWRRYLRILRLSLMYLSTMIVMSMLLTYLRGIFSQFYISSNGLVRSY